MDGSRFQEASGTLLDSFVSCLQCYLVLLNVHFPFLLNASADLPDSFQELPGQPFAGFGLIFVFLIIFMNAPDVFQAASASFRGCRTRLARVAHNTLDFACLVSEIQYIAPQIWGGYVCQHFAPGGRSFGLNSTKSWQTSLLYAKYNILYQKYITKMTFASF